MTPLVKRGMNGRESDPAGGSAANTRRRCSLDRTDMGPLALLSGSGHPRACHSRLDGRAAREMCRPVEVSILAGAFSFRAEDT
jgi:hypothetical protein